MDSRRAPGHTHALWGRLAVESGLGQTSPREWVGADWLWRVGFGRSGDEPPAGARRYVADHRFFHACGRFSPYHSEPIQFSTVRRANHLVVT
jgi:hypothetical protein